VTPSRHFPDVGRGDVIVGPVSFGFLDHTFEVSVGLLGLLLRPEPSFGGRGRRLAFIIPPS
jgi:hypothetical protein